MTITTIDPESKGALATLGDRIKSVRRTWKWSQQEMAEALRVDQASISFWERDKIRPSGSAIVALASLFRTSVDALEGGSEFNIPDSPSLPGSAEREFPRSVCLPIGSKEMVMVVDLADGSSKGDPVSEAMMTLAMGVKANRRVWVVIE